MDQSESVDYVMVRSVGWVISVYDHFSGWDVGSLSGIKQWVPYTGERCRPQSRFMDCLLLRCMASMVLLF